MYADKTRSRNNWAQFVTVKDAGVDQVIYRLPPTKRPDLDSVTVFSVHKAGSVLLNKIVGDLCRHVGLTYVGLPQECFRIGYPVGELPPTTSQVFVKNGYCYGGFRFWPVNFHIPIIGSSRPILLVRDPRDRLVSHYFSMRESHGEPGNQFKNVRLTLSNRERARRLSVDDYVIEVAGEFLAHMVAYRTQLCEETDTKIYRYEDVIYEKSVWVQSLVKHFGWDVSDDLCATIAARHDLIPDQEDTSKHVRQVHPGNFRKHLSQRTIDDLNSVFEQEMRFFGYDLR